MTIDEIQDRVIEEMSGLAHRIERYEYLVELGRELDDGNEEIRTDENAIPGCQARVWIRAEMNGERLRLRADSDALITRGLIALLLRVLDDHPPEEIAEADLYFLERTGLATHLSPSRANGLATMVERIRSYARARGEGG